MALRGSPETYRAELARHGISHTELAATIRMNRQQLSMLLAGSRPLRAWARHNISLGINRIVGADIFAVDARLGLLPASRGHLTADLACAVGGSHPPTSPEIGGRQPT